MPYIKGSDRRVLDDAIVKLLVKLRRMGQDGVEGRLNYIITLLLMGSMPAKLSYKSINRVMGVLECVKQELYRRVAAPYEDEKIEENGDLYPIANLRWWQEGEEEL